jgi:LacI family transcriptional regulator
LDYDLRSMAGDGNSHPPAHPTNRDVARLAGVAKTTASDALQGRGRVSEATRTRVEAAAAALRYRPHAGARDLTLRRSEVLGLLVGDFFDPFNAELTGLLEQRAAANGYRVLLATAGPDLQEEGIALSNLLEHRVAALILVAYTGDDAGLLAITEHTPVVLIGYSGSVGVSIGLDDLTGALLAVGHLLDLGHTRIAYVSGTLIAPSTDAARISGYRAALRRAGIEQEAMVKVGPHSDSRRNDVVRELLSRPDRPTAIFAASDITAIEVMSCAMELGLRIPEDLSIVGFDDMQLSRLPMISLTTVAQPIAELARLGIEAATKWLTTGEVAQPAMIEPQLIVRRSTGPPPT